MNNKVMEIELSVYNPAFNDYYYADLAFPAEDYEVRDAMQRVRGGDIETAILSCDTLPALTNVRLDTPTLDELNFFAKRLAELNEDERIVLQAVTPKYLDEDNEPISMRDLINLTYGLDVIPVIPGICTDKQLGEFVIENDLNEDIASIPETSLYLLDKSRIGKLQRENDGGVFTDGFYVAAGKYTLPEVYDGKNLPEQTGTADYVFRLKLTGTSLETWLNLPSDSLSDVFGENRILNFESSIPQITSDMFIDTENFHELNRLATKISLFSPIDQVKFKAVLSAEQPKDISAAIEIVDSLWKYEMTASPSNSDQFFKQYLAHHLDSQFDSEWLDTLLAGNEGNRLLKRLGASATDYGIISARGHSLYELVPYNEPEVRTEIEPIKTDEEFEVIELLGYTALFTNERIALEDVPEGLYRYDLRYSDESDSFLSVEPHVGVNHGGSVLMTEELDFGEHGFIAFDDDTSPNFLGECMTAEEFRNRNLSEEQTGGMNFE